MYGYIYKTTNLITGDIYIGKHKHNTKDLDESYIGSGTRLLRSINKYGKDNFKCEVIAYSNTKEYLDLLERYHIKIYRNLYKDSCINIADGGEGGSAHRGYKHSEATKAKISQISSNMSNDTKNKIRNSVKLLWQNDAYVRKRLSSSKSAIDKRVQTNLKRYGFENYSQTIEGRNKIKKRMLNHKVSDECREKLRQANLGKKYSPEVNAKKAGDRKGKKLIYSPEGKRCYVYEWEIEQKILDGYFLKEDFKNGLQSKNV